MQMIDRWLWGPSLVPQSHLFPGYVASMAFYLILSSAPLLLVAVGIAVQFIHLDPAGGIDDLLEKILPKGLLLDPHALMESAQRASGRGMVTATFLVAIWSSSNFITQVVMCLRMIFHADVDSAPSGWMNRALSFLLLLMWGLLMGLAATIIVMAPGIERALAYLGIFSTAALSIWSWGRHIMAFFLLFGLFWTTYRVTSGRRYPPLDVIRTALLATLGWLILGYLFSHVLIGLWTKNIVYGTLGGLVATMMWAYFCCWIILLCACWLQRAHAKTDEVTTT